MVFDGSGSFVLPSSCAGVASVIKAITGVQGRIPLRAKNGVFDLRTWELEDRPSTDFSRRGAGLKGPSTRLNKPGPPVRPSKEKKLGPFRELSTPNPGAEVPGVAAPEVAPNVSARGAADADMGDEAAQRGVSDAESIGGEIREPRRRNSPSDPTSREIEDHVLTGHASFRS